MSNEMKLVSYNADIYKCLYKEFRLLESKIDQTLKSV